MITKHTENAEAVTANETSAREGCILICDVSGFVKTANAHHKQFGAKIGAEKTRLWLDSIFEVILSSIESSGGEVIQFIGDAVVACFAPSRLRGALDCALQIRQQCQGLSDSGDATARIGLEDTVQVKTGLAYGTFERLKLLRDVHVTEAKPRPRTESGTELTQKLTEEPSLNRDPLEAAVGSAVLGALEALQLAGQEDAVCDASFYHQLGLTPASSANLEFQALDGGFFKLIESTPALPPSALALYDSSEGLGDPTQLNEVKLLTILYLEFLLPQEDISPTALLELYEVIQPIIREHNATLIGLCQTLQGARFQCAVGSQRSEVNDVELAIQLATRVQEGLPQQLGARSRASIGYGNAWQGRYGGHRYKLFNAHGREVNLAARLLGTQDAGCTCLTEGARQQLNDRLYLKDLGELNIKGEAQPVRIYGVAQGLDGFLQNKLQANPLCGRQAELQQVLHALESASEDKVARLIEITGPAGVGKSTFIGALQTALASTGQHTIEVRSNPQSRLLPFAVAYPLLLELGNLDGATALEHWLNTRLEPYPHLVPWMGLISLVSPLQLPLSEQAELANPDARSSAITQLFKTLIQDAVQRHALTFMIEDLQWFDNASIQLLTEALFKAPHCQSLYSIRTSEGRQETKALLERLLKIETPRLAIALKPFSESETPAFLMNWFGVDRVPSALSAALHKLSDGNLLLISSLLQHLEQEGIVQRSNHHTIEVDFKRLELFSSIPTSMEHALQTRIDSLAPPHRLVLSHCSIFKSAFSLDELQAVFHPTDSTALEPMLTELLKRRLIKPYPHAQGQSRFVFEHQVIEQCTYDRIPFEERKKLHARCATWLEGRLQQAHGGDQLRLTIRLAAQYDWAGLLHKAVPLSQQAVDYAMRLGALEEAADRLDKLLGWFTAKLLPDASKFDHASWMEKRAQIVYAQGQLAEAQERYTLALSLLGHKVPSQPPFITHYARWGLRLIYLSDRLPLFLRPKRKALTPEARLTIRLYMCISELSFLKGEGYMNYIYLLRALGVSRKFETASGDQIRVLTGCVLSSLVFNQKKWGDHFTMEVYKGLAGVTDEIEKHRAAAYANHRLGYLEYSKGRLDLAEQMIGKAVDNARLGQEFQTEVLAYSLFILFRVAQGRFDDALEFYNRYEALAKKYASSYFNVFHQYGLINQKIYCLAMLGRLSEAREALNFLEQIAVEFKFSGLSLIAVHRCKLMVLYQEKNWSAARELAVQNASELSEDVTNKAYLFTCVSLPLEVLLDALHQHAAWTPEERSVAKTLLSTLDQTQTRFKLVTPTFLILNAKYLLYVERRIGKARKLLERALELSNQMGLSVEQTKAALMLTALRENQVDPS